MNNTNRALNRTVLLIAGILLLVAGGSAVTALAWPKGAELWQTGLDAAHSWFVDVQEWTRISDTTTLSWFLLVVLAVIVLLIVLAIGMICRLGGGRSSVVVRDEGGPDSLGPVTIREGFAADAITSSLANHAEILTSKVSTHRLRGDDVLHVSVTPRQNVSPVQVADTVGRLVDNLATLTGRQTPTCITIHTGVRARLAADQPRVS